MFCLMLYPIIFELFALGHVMENHVTSEGEKVCSCRSGDENKNSLIFLLFYTFGDVMESEHQGVSGNEDGIIDVSILESETLQELQEISVEENGVTEIYVGCRDVIAVSEDIMITQISSQERPIWNKNLEINTKATFEGEKRYEEL